MKKKLSIIVPVYNEVNTVLIVLNKLKKLNLYNNFSSEIIVIDDSENKKHYRNTYVNYKPNLNNVKISSYTLANFLALSLLQAHTLGATI